MNQDGLQKRPSSAMKEKGQYFIAFGVVAAMLMVAGFPTFIVFFFGIFAFFLWRTFASPSRSETREIFEFYLSANDILRDEDRRWYGFEIREVIGRGERILKLMSAAPPLVYFTLGALYQKAGDYQSAVKHLAYVLENENSDEMNYAFPTPDLKNYVKVLRKIEREPHEAPLTAAAIRSLERARRSRGKIMLEDSRAAAFVQKEGKQQIHSEQAPARIEPAEQPDERNLTHSIFAEDFNPPPENPYKQEPRNNVRRQEKAGDNKQKSGHEDINPYPNHKSISEVLHDVYDKNLQ